MNNRLFEHGATKPGKVVENIERDRYFVQVVRVVGAKELHVLHDGAEDRSAIVGDKGRLTYAKSPTGGQWEFTKDLKC